MWFDVPVLAYRSSVIPESLGPAGVMFADKDDLGHVAATAAVLAFCLAAYALAA
jgi:hypothetical protein